MKKAVLIIESILALGVIIMGSAYIPWGYSESDYDGFIATLLTSFVLNIFITIAIVSIFIHYNNIKITDYLSNMKEKNA